MFNTLINLILILSRVLIFIVIVDVFIGYFLPPHHNVRVALDRIVEPVLTPIRRILPNTGMIDFSPFVLILLIYILQTILIGLLRG